MAQVCRYLREPDKEPRKAQTLPRVFTVYSQMCSFLFLFLMPAEVTEQAYQHTCLKCSIKKEKILDKLSYHQILKLMRGMEQSKKYGPGLLL